MSHENIPTSGRLSPLESLRATVKETVKAGAEEAAKSPAEEKAPAPQVFSAPAAEKREQRSEPADTPPATEPKTRVIRKTTVPKKTSSLLAKCMPFISDEQGNRYMEEKPNYTLESVEDIIQSAERKADEKIAKMYNLSEDDIQRIGTGTPARAQKASAEPEKTEKPRIRVQQTSVKRPLKIGETAAATTKYDTVSIPKVSNTLFDDFSARRTDVEGDERITTSYSKSSAQSAEDSHTRAIPDLHPETERRETFEDIVSHSRPKEPEDISSSSKKRRRAALLTGEENEVKVNEFRGAEDVRRVGSDLKLDVVLTRFRLFATAILTAAAGCLHIPVFKDFLPEIALSIISIIALGLAFTVNFGVMLSFKDAFTRNTRIELPLAFAALFMVIYFVYGIITAAYPWEPTLLLLISYLVYDYCAWRRASAVFGNFRLIATRRSKYAVTLIDDTSTTSAMARSSIDGEVLAASSREVGDLDDFLKNTAGDRALAGKAGLFTACALVFAVVIAFAVGFAFSSVSVALLSAATIMCLAAAPSLFISDMLPFAAASDKLHKERAGICSKYSAERLEQINAAVITSAELFPRGCVTLCNMTPLGANELDETLTLAASLAKEIDSPLAPLFSTILDDSVILPDADSVKYEENLGISGWASDHHVMIGNRSLMQSHGVRVPALDVDRNILHKGYFPVYIACDQRACALLVVRYSTSKALEAELGRLSDKNVTLLVENCDPNITEQMLCDYYSLYPDRVRILDHNGVAKHRKATEYAEKLSAHGFHRGSTMGFLSVLTAAFRLRTLSNLLYILHVITAVVTWLLFAGISLGGSLDLMSVIICALCQLAGAVVSLTAYFIGK